MALMIEPTETESLHELDQFIDAMIAINKKGCGFLAHSLPDSTLARGCVRSVNWAGWFC